MRAPSLLFSMLTLVLSFTACSNVDPADIALAERDDISSVISQRTTFSKIQPELIANGYVCSPGSGRFFTESGEEKFAFSFLQCVKKTKPLFGCSISVRVIAVPNGKDLAQVNFFGGNSCI